jgi:prolyl oligopeptidase
VKRTLAIATLSLLVGSAALARKLPLPKPPPHAEKRPVAEVLHGVEVVDDYRWLENASDPQVKAWVAAHSEYAAAKLNQLPATSAILKRLIQIDEASEVTHVPVRVGKQWYAYRLDPKKSAPVIVKPTSLESVASAPVLLDANALDPSGLTSIDLWRPSFDGQKLAVSLSRKGSELGTAYVFDASGERLPDEIPHVNGGTAGGALAWLPDSSGFFYTRYPREGERPAADLDFYQELWLHKLGTPVAQDTMVLSSKELPKIAEIKLGSSEDGAWLVVQVNNGDGGEIAWWVRSPAGKLFKVADYKDGVKQAQVGADGALYLLSIKDAPLGQILRAPLTTPTLAKASVVVREGRGPVQSFVVTRSKIFVTRLVGGPSEASVYGLDGTGEQALPTSAQSTVSGLLATDPMGDEILFTQQSYVEPRSAWRWTPGAQQPPRRIDALSQHSPVDFSAYEVERVSATSKDGTKVPMMLVHKKGLKRNGKHPTLLTAYGGYGSNNTPYFSPFLIVWLERGGVFATASIRGGGEFGEAWHQNGMLTRKQNVFDDFIACAEWLVTNKVTAPKKLAVQGASNGGLLMGAVLTQRPELFGAVVSQVGIYDMLRFETEQNGVFNTTEFGSVKDPAQFQALHAYSPYHNVKDGAPYPPILLVTGENDPRVSPMHSRKFAARLEAAGAKQVLLLTNADAGHSVPNRDQRLRQRALITAFLLSSTGDGVH